MSYRTYVENEQIFGNNDYFEKWIEFIKSQGIEVGEDGDYDGEITDFPKALKTIEEIVLDLEKEYRESKKPSHWKKSIFDFSDIYEEIKEENGKHVESLTDKIEWKINHAYAFIPYYFLKICKDKLDCSKFYPHTCKLKKGETINVSAG